MKNSPRYAWLPVMSLALAAFTFSTSEFLPVALLSDIGQSFHYPATKVGVMITLYAWGVSLTSLPCMLLTRHMDRKKLVLRAFILFILSHLLSALAWNFTVLMISRIGVAIAHAIFWAITASIAMRIAPAGGKTKALSMLVLGTSLAAILGLPCGRILNELFNWRMAFVIIGLLALVGFVILKRQLPALTSQNSDVLGAFPLLLKQPALVMCYWLMLLLTAAHFCAYGYIEPFISRVAHGSSSLTTAILFVFGIAGILASSLFSSLNRYPFMFLAGSIALQAVATFLLLPLSSSPVMLLGLSLLWGMAMTWIALALQLRILDMAHDAADLATSLYSTVYNVGVGAGALLGQQVAQHVGITHIGEVAALLAFIGLGCYYLFSWRQAMRHSLTHHNLP
ncbi:sugar transporter [Celerinatantimonas sp. YJH-8]|uniref:sugar transporter n=1 Tax=Celerinatantimonas sp. YJH-8 TaxID=3228714 RepID=UPI0038C0E938